MRHKAKIVALLLCATLALAQSTTYIKIGGSQALTGVQGTTGAKLFACTGTFTNGNLVKSDANGNCADSGASFSAPGAIGGGTPNSGAFTSVSSTGGNTFGSSSNETAAACETSFGLTTLNVGGTTTDTGLNCLPATAIVDSVVYRITTTITTAASFTIGDGTTAARFCGTQSVLTSGTTGICFVQADQTGAAGPRQTAAAAVRVTTNVNPGAGAIRLIVYYHTWVAPTS